MKRAMRLLAALVVVFGFAACDSKDDGSSGTYNLYYTEPDGPVCSATFSSSSQDVIRLLIWACEDDGGTYYPSPVPLYRQ